jgi:hypothetical protein
VTITSLRTSSPDAAQLPEITTDQGLYVDVGLAADPKLATMFRGQRTTRVPAAPRPARSGETGALRGGDEKGIGMGTNRLIWAPISALRTVFTGVGRIVMVADRPQDAPGRAGDAASQRWRSLDLTGNVRLLSADDLDDGEAAAAVPVAPAEAADSAGPQGETAAPPDAAEGGADGAADGADPESEAANLPLAAYDSLTLPSIRARLRSLDADQLRALAAYERTHAERPDVLRMLERRIERLETGR